MIVQSFECKECNRRAKGCGDGRSEARGKRPELRVWRASPGERPSGSGRISSRTLRGPVRISHARTDFVRDAPRAGADFAHAYGFRPRGSRRIALTAAVAPARDPARNARGFSAIRPGSGAASEAAAQPRSRAYVSVPPIPEPSLRSSTYMAGRITSMPN